LRKRRKEEIEKVQEYVTRMGDGRPIRMTKKQIRDELEEGTKAMADKAKVPQLTSSELDYLEEIITAPMRVVSVKPGCEVVLTNDVGTLKVMGDQSNSGVQLPTSREEAMTIYERVMCVDTAELAHIDYSFKPVKPIISTEQSTLQNVLQMTMLPIFYGAMPNIGLYYVPDGPFPEPIALIRERKFKEARESMEKAADRLTEDIVYIAKKLYAVGADGLNIDTTAAGGDPDFYASLRAVEILKKECPDLSIEMGMAGECILGFHTELKYKGVRLAGLWPHQQVKVAEMAGVDIFGPVVNTKPNKSFPWNLAYAVTAVKECVRVSSIPIHVNMGMGVGGIPMCETPPIDCVTRANKAMIEIAGVDGV
jgi:dimethylamine--corrinoid protein Co-methyltransferase